MHERAPNRTPLPRRRAPFWQDTRGAVYVEFLIAFMPVFAFFLCLLQLTLLFSAKLVVEHAATQGARAAAVVFGDEPGPYGGRRDAVHSLSAPRREAVRDAVVLSLAPLILDGSVTSVRVAYPREDAPGGEDQPEGAPISPMTRTGTPMVRVRVEAELVCKIAMASALLCDAGPSPLRVTVGVAESLFPYQGANYAYE